MSEYSQPENYDLDVEISKLKLDDLNADTLEINDTQLSRMLDKYEIGHGPILETTRTLYKRLLVRAVKKSNASSTVPGVQPTVATATTIVQEQRVIKADKKARDIEKLACDYSEDEDNTDDDSDGTTTYEDESESYDDDDDSTDLIEMPTTRSRAHRAQSQAPKKVSNTRYYIILAVISVLVAYYLASQLDG